MQTVGPLIHRDTGETVLDRVQIAAGFWSRFRGLQLRKSLPEGTGLLLVPCASIHTCFMRFPIDVVTLDKEARVLEIRSGLKPWRIFAPTPKPYAILELPAGTNRLAAGDRLAFPSHAHLPSKQLQFLQLDCNNTS